MNTLRIELDDHLRAQLVAVAERRGLSPEAFVEALVRKEVGQDAPEPAQDAALAAGLSYMDRHADALRELAK